LLFTQKELSNNLGDVLYVFPACALKTRNEAVVEGIGSVVNMHASSRRGMSAEMYEHEAFIHFNGPPLARADGLIKAALNDHFDGKPWHFNHTSVAGQRSTNSMQGGSKVLRRHKGDVGKLPFLADADDDDVA
jgi:hypothetical protein